MFLNETRRANGQAFGPDGRLYAVATSSSQVLAYDAGGQAKVIAEGIRGNDLVVRHDGALYVTEPSVSGRETSKIWYISPGGEKRVVDTGLKYANGVTLSPDQSLLYVADFRSHWVYSYQVQPDGSLAHKQRYYHLHVPDNADDAGADGIRVDRDGRLYVATRMGIQVCDQAGRVNCIIPTPNGKVANLCFGGTRVRRALCHLRRGCLQAEGEGQGGQCFPGSNQAGAAKVMKCLSDAHPGSVAFEARSGIVKEVLNTPGVAPPAHGQAERAGLSVRENSVVSITRSNESRPRHSLSFTACTVVAIAGLIAPASSGAAEPAKRSGFEFNRDVRPILSENCYACHGPDKNRRKAKLRLDERASAVRSQAIVPGKPDESELVARVFEDDAEQIMPPPSTHKTLTAAQKEVLKQWIAEGAEYQAHWAYVPPKRPSVPTVQNSSWVRNPIDAFILHTLESNAIAPSPEADRATLIRRLSLDLLGLPPTPEEVRAFEHDTDPRAYERLVDRLLESPHYGERMAVPWLDLARFADTVGYHGDQGQRVFPYRDYVIDSFNSNKPFDQFTTEQLAGDLLPRPTTEQLVATCFNRLNMMTREGGAQPGEYLAKYASDRVRTVAITWLGSTMGCAECHDHKYDPFTSARLLLAGSILCRRQAVGGLLRTTITRPIPSCAGWDNDHPFPPEIEVESPYLKRRQEQLREQIRQLCCGAFSRATAEPRREAAVRGLDQEYRRFPQVLTDRLEDADSHDRD